MKRWLMLGAALAGGAALVRALRRRDPVPLWGKVIVVTGASSGIGRAAARLFAAEGARVVLVARRADVLAEAQRELDPFGVPSLLIAADVTQDADVQRIVDETLTAFGRMDVLVNNAGLSYGGYVHEMPEKRVRDLVAVNLTGPIRLTQAVLPVMIRQGSGHIVNVSSMAGQLAAPGMAVYGATRRGLIAFSDALRRELDRTGIAVSSVLPTWTETPMTGGLKVETMRAARVLTVVERFDAPDVPARAIVDAVRYRLREVVMGGAQMRYGYVWERLAPWMLDLYWRYVVDRRAWEQIGRDLGT